MIEDAGLGGDAEGVEDRGGEALGGDGVVRGVGGVLVGAADRWCRRGCRRRRAARGTACSSGRGPSGSCPGRAAHLAEGDDQRLVEQAAVVEVVQQRGQGLVEGGSRWFFTSSLWTCESQL